MKYGENGDGACKYVSIEKHRILNINYMRF